MAFSTQNKMFLEHLRSLEIDLKQFPDQSFDGLFDNVPNSINYFFNWFLQNISSDNVLTELEQATYFELEKNHLLPTEDEMNFTLSMSSPTYRELQSLEKVYVNEFLLESLQDLNENYKNLNDIFSSLEANHCEIKRKYNNLKEKASVRKKQFSVVKERSNEINSLFSSNLDSAKELLSNEPFIELNINPYKSLLMKEENISYKLLKTESFPSSNIVQFTKLEEDLAHVEVFLIFSQGILNSKKTKIKFLTDILQNELNQKSFDESYGSDFILSCAINDKEDIELKTNQTQILEDKLYGKMKVISHNEIKKIVNQYFIKGVELNNIYLSHLLTCQDYAKSIQLINLWCLHIICGTVNDLEKIFELRKEFHSELRRTEINFRNNISNFELKRQRYKEASNQISQHPFLIELKNVMNPNEKPESNTEALEKIVELMICGNDDLNFVSHKFRIDLQSSIKSLFNDVLCGPTSQLLFTSTDLLMKFQNCERRDSELSNEIKHLVNKYVDAKEIVSSNERNKLLLWMNFLADSAATLRSNLEYLEPKS